MADLHHDRYGRPRYVVDDAGCWVWQAAFDKDGYGRLWWGGQTRRAHRVYYTQLVGEIPGCLEIDHLCRVRCCVNPAHMEPVTKLENVMRGVGPSAQNARKMHCAHGHPLSGKNLYVLRTADGTKRRCRVCMKREAAKRRENFTPEYRAILAARQRAYTARLREKAAQHG